jgi:hypothetical protein
MKEGYKGYTSGEETIKCMISRIEYLNSNNKQANEDELSILNEMYSLDRLAAIVLGMNINKFPRKLKINTRLPK